MTDRLRGRKLQARRLRIWSQNPCCAKCGKLTAFTARPGGFELDHIDPLKADGGNGEDTDENCQVLCVDRDRYGNKTGCHAKKTADDMGYRFKPTIGADGWPVEESN
jgi:5-methylcytosine-specific restriction protein A